eukprot:Colp12_sorted_trinity150504_noHs@34171
MKAFAAVLVLCLVGSTFALKSADKFKEWVMAHNKIYKNALEEAHRAAIFFDNLQYILEHNAGNHSYTLGLNTFADLTEEEFRTTVLASYIPARPEGGSVFLAAENVDLPTSVDWRSKGYVTAVKNQQQCGSCWTFSTTGSVEGQHFKKTGKLVSLSEQQLVDCAGSKWQNNGCSGGLMDNAFKYIKANGGIMAESAYPYTATDGKTCKFDKSKVVATVTGYVDVKANDEKALQNAVATVGPISIAINAGTRKFQLYSSGVFDDSTCTADLDHGVLLVGYGTESAKDYWLVKNSWGASWGDKGYIKMSRNKKNQCGIAAMASYPLV